MLDEAKVYNNPPITSSEEVQGMLIVNARVLPLKTLLRQKKARTSIGTNATNGTVRLD